MSEARRWDDFSGRVAIVTGGGSGIGAGVVRALVARGARVAVFDINEAAASEVASESSSAPGVALPVGVDVTQPAAVSSVVGRVRNLWGRVDILVNAAGGFERTTMVEEIELAEWEKVIALNLTSAFVCSKAVAPSMKEQRYGRIVNVSSEAGRMPLVTSGAHYAAAKAGLLGFTRHLARELGGYGITVNAVAPGTTLTPRVARLRTGETLAFLESLTPLGRVAEVEDQVGPILFFASDASGYVTGATLDVTGGRVMM